MLQWVVAGAWSVGRTGVRKGSYVGYVMNAVRYPLVGQSTVTSTKYKRAGIALLPFGSASTLNCQSQLLIGSLDFWSSALDCAWSVGPIFIAEVAQKKHPSSEDAPLKKVSRSQVRPCAETAMDAEVASPGRLEVQLQELQSATGRGKDIHALAPPAMSEEGTTPRACLEGLQAQIQELLANEDYAGAAAIKEEMRVAEITE